MCRKSMMQAVILCPLNQTLAIISGMETLVQYGHELITAISQVSLLTEDNYRKEEPTDLLNSLKTCHHSLISKLSDTYVKEYENQADLLTQILPLGLANEAATIQNMCVVLNKVMTRETVHILDQEEHRSILELMVLVMQHWITQFIHEDKFVLNNTLNIMEQLTKSWAFCSAFKHRPALERLLNYSKDPMLPSSTKH